MALVRKWLPLVVAVAFGLLTLVGLLFAPALASLLTGWAAFLAAAALLLGVLNLLLVHGRRLAQGSGHSAVLIASMLAVFVLAFTDSQGMTDGYTLVLFTRVLRPLESALASLMAFFLLFAGYHLLRHQQSGWSLLFVASVVLFLLASVPMPAGLGDLFGWVRELVSPLVVSAGVRGILIGVALGTLTLSLRLLFGAEQPYGK